MKIGITGSNGYVGSVLSEELRESGHTVVSLGRRPEDQFRFRLGSDVPIQEFSELKLDALVHCAYDFTKKSYDESREVNVVGTENLFKSAKAAEIKKILLISSISSFPEACSIYGRVKFESEEIAKRIGATIVRPGLVYGTAPRSLLGTLVKIGAKLPILPIFGASAPLYLCHDKTLAKMIRNILEGDVPGAGECFTLAAKESWDFSQVIRFFCQKINGTVPVIIPIPWQLVWLGLRGLEILKIPIPIRSDSVLGLVYQNPNLSHEWNKNSQEIKVSFFPLPHQVTHE